MCRVRKTEYYSLRRTFFRGKLLIYLTTEVDGSEEDSGERPSK